MAPLPPLAPDETMMLRIIAQDPSIRVHGRILTADVEVPAEQVQRGPWGHRVQVVDYDASRRMFYKPLEYRRDREGRVVDPFATAIDSELLTNPGFHQQNVYAIVMRTLAAFERALGRRLAWGFGAHQLKVVPHSFEDANAFYSEEDYGLFFGSFATANGRVFTCLSHDVVVHETAHALLDGLRQRFTDPSSPDQAAFHEGFADMVALLSVLQLPEVVSELLARAGRVRSKARVPREFLKNERFVRDTLFGLAEELGASLYQIPGRALRASYASRSNPRAYADPRFEEPHVRGELLVAVMLRAFVEVWQVRVEPLGVGGRGPLDRDRVVEEGASAAKHLLNIAIRALDYTPPVHLTFRDYLSAVLTADREVQPDDRKYEYRRRLRESFAGWGILPSAGGPDRTRAEQRALEPGGWCPIDSSCLSYAGIHQEAMRRDPDEVFRFIWENRGKLRLHREAYSRVQSIRPCRRQAPDGAPIHETVAEFFQIWEPTLAEMRRYGLEALEGAADEEGGLKLYGGGTLVFDDFGRLKYHVHNSVANVRRQRERLGYMRGAPVRRVTTGRRFAELHRLRAADPSRLTVGERW
jgi:hypothetical protein